MQINHASLGRRRDMCECEVIFNPVDRQRRAFYNITCLLFIFSIIIYLIIRDFLYFITANTDLRNCR